MLRPPQSQSRGGHDFGQGAVTFRLGTDQTSRGQIEHHAAAFRIVNENLVEQSFLSLQIEHFRVRSGVLHQQSVHAVEVMDGTFHEQDPRARHRAGDKTLIVVGVRQSVRVLGFPVLGKLRMLPEQRSQRVFRVADPMNDIQSRDFSVDGRLNVLAQAHVGNGLFR